MGQNMNDFEAGFCCDFVHGTMRTAMKDVILDIAEVCMWGAGAVKDVG
jgi:hypothetical protein